MLCQHQQTTGKPLFPQQPGVLGLLELAGLQAQALNELLPRGTHGLALGTQTSGAALCWAVYASPFLNKNHKFL